MRSIVFSCSQFKLHFYDLGNYNITGIVAKVSGVKHTSGVRFLPFHLLQSALVRDHHRTEILGTGVLMDN